MILILPIERFGYGAYTQRKATVLCSQPDVRTAALSPNGKILATGTLYGQISLWDVATGKSLLSWVVSRRKIYDIDFIAFSPNGKTLATASGDPALVTLWDIGTGKLIASFKHTNDAEGIAFSPDGKMLAIANWQGIVYLWDLTTKTTAAWRAHMKPVTDVAFSPEDGRTLATASDDGTIKLWNVATKQEMLTLQTHTTQVKSIAFSPDGNSLLTFGDGKTLLWRAANLKEIEAKERSLAHD